MATVRTASAVELGGDQWVCMPATWEIYRELLETRGEKSRPRYIFLDGSLTAVTTGNPHEMLKTRLGGLIKDVLVGLRIQGFEGGVMYSLSSSPVALQWRRA